MYEEEGIIKDKRYHFKFHFLWGGGGNVSREYLSYMRLFIIFNVNFLEPIVILMVRFIQDLQIPTKDIDKSEQTNLRVSQAWRRTKQKES